MFLLKPVLLTDWDPKSSFPQFNEETPLSLGSLNKTLVKFLVEAALMMYKTKNQRGSQRKSFYLGAFKFRLASNQAACFIKFSDGAEVFSCHFFFVRITSSSKKKKH